MRVRRRALRPDSGGAGRFRGGCGQIYELQSVADAPITVRAEHGKLATAPRGLRGGLAGSAGGVYLNGEPVPDKLPVTLHRGDVLQLHVPGSGGMYAPADARPRRRWRATSPMASSRREAALRDYGHAPEARRCRQVARAAPRSASGCILGVDIGGTFTDFVLLEQATGRVMTGKVLTRTDDLAAGVLDGVHELLARHGVRGQRSTQGRARHDARDECAHRAARRAHRADRHRAAFATSWSWRAKAATTSSTSTSRCRRRWCRAASCSK